jgi:hypothetical protein
LSVPLSDYQLFDAASPHLVATHALFPTMR